MKNSPQGGMGETNYAVPVEASPLRRMVMVTGRTNPELAQSIAQELNSSLSSVALREFANGEIHCRFEDSIRGADVFTGERFDHGATHHDRRRQACLGQAHHGGLSELRLRPPRPQVDRS